MTTYDSIAQTFFQGYLHQDWVYEHATVWGAVDTFILDASAQDIKDLRTALKNANIEAMSEPEAQEYVLSTGCEYWPPGDGLTFCGWLSSLQKYLATRSSN